MLTAPQNPADGLSAVRERITIAARAAGRDPASITLIGVCKSQPTERVQSALAAGLADLGENYVQEARAHFEALAGRDFRRHFIGALQTNKTREAATLFDWVHTVDRIRIAERLSAQRPESLPPAETQPARQRHWFAELRRLLEGLNAAGHRLDALSMGMSGDFEAAIAEGSSMVRIGTAIFGERSRARAA